MLIQHVERVTSHFLKPITDSFSVCPENRCPSADDLFVTYALSTSASSTADISKNTRCLVAIKDSLLCCLFCSENYHTKNVCPARRTYCDFFLSRGHFSIVCEQRKSSLEHEVASSFPGSQHTLAKTLVPVMVNGYNLTALIDTGSTDSVISLSTNLVYMFARQPQPQQKLYHNWMLKVLPITIFKCQFFQASLMRLSLGMICYQNTRNS